MIDWVLFKTFQTKTGNSAATSTKCLNALKVATCLDRASITTVSEPLRGLSHKMMPTLCAYSCHIEPGMTHGTVAPVFYYIIEDFKRILACFHLLPQSNKTVISKPYSHLKRPQTDCRAWYDMIFVPQDILEDCCWCGFLLKWTTSQVKRLSKQSFICLLAGSVSAVNSFQIMEKIL